MALVVAPPLELVAQAQAQIRQDGLQLRVKRLPDAIELVIQDAGAGSALEQQRSGTIWTGELRTDRERGLKAGPQSLAMPDAGLERITFDGTGRLFQLKVTPQMGRTVGPPVISSDGRDLTVRFPAPQLPVSQTIRPNLTQPTALPTPAYVPPLRPRAVAPPLGDMAVGSMSFRQPGALQLNGPRVTMTLRNVPVRDALMAVTRLGSYGFVYVPESVTQAQDANALKSSEELKFTYQNQAKPSTTDPLGRDVKIGPDNLSIYRDNPRPVNVSFYDESFTNAINALLAAGGLQGRLQGRTIFAGPSLLALSSYGPQLTKVYRLNQVSAANAAQYLASLGALISIPQAIRVTQSSGNSTNTGGGSANGGSTSSSTNTSTSTSVQIQTFGGQRGPLLGITGTVDSRLSTITLVGDPPAVAIAEGHLRQIDLRQRQVALSVKILDVTLNNDTDIDNSFALRFGNNFIVNDSGRLLAAFGRNLPARQADFLTSRETINTTNDQSSTSSQNSGANSSTGFSNSLTATFDNTRNLNQSQIEQINANLSRQTGTEIQKFTENTFVPNPNATGPSDAFLEVENDVFRVVPIGRTTQTFSSDLVSRIQDVITSSTGQNVTLRRTATGSSNQGRDQSSSADSSRFVTGSGVRRTNPGLNYPDNQFFNFLQAQITSSNTKVLASPTLIIQEGGIDASDVDKSIDRDRISVDGQIGRSRDNEAFVRVGTQLVTSYQIQQDTLGNNFCQPIFGNAGLTFGARVDKIDDNGFVTFSLSPEISAEVGQQSAGTCGIISLINDRILDTGKVRVRDGQTLILTGVISDTDRQEVSKWPVLGDLPFIGQFFRRTGGSRTKSELVIMVTPRIINDEQGGTYGYGYTPSTQDARRLIYSSGQ